MAVRVEFYGIPRQRAGVSCTSVDAHSLSDALLEIERRFPQLSDGCIRDGRLQEGYVANVGGDRFVTDPETALKDGDAVLILSADAGG